MGIGGSFAGRDLTHQSLDQALCHQLQPQAQFGGQNMDQTLGHIQSKIVNPKWTKSFAMNYLSLELSATNYPRCVANIWVIFSAINWLSLVAKL